MTRRVRWGALVLLALTGLHAVLALAAAVAGRDDEGTGALVAVLVVLATSGALLAVGPVTAVRRRVAALAATPDELAEPPNDRHPALVALLVGARGPGFRSAVAATVLRLVERGQLRLEGLDAERFRLSVVPDARGEVPVEWYVLQNLLGGASRRQGRTLQGPPLWDDGMWRRPRLGTFERDVEQLAANERLLAPALSPFVLFFAPMALGACMLGLGSGLAVGVLTWGFGVGPFVGLGASSLFGRRRTATGEVEAARWLAHARWLRRTANLDDLGVPAFQVWGEHLTLAVATGVAPRAARALSPDL